MKQSLLIIIPTAIISYIGGCFTPIFSDFIKSFINSKKQIKKIKSIYKCAPGLINEMANDFQDQKYNSHREFILLDRDTHYSAGDVTLAYYYQDHQNLKNMLKIMNDYKLVSDISLTYVPKYRLYPHFHDYLMAFKINPNLLSNHN